MKIDHLSKEEKLALLGALDEKQKREKRRRDRFKPNDLQRRVIESSASTKIVTAANGVGKSALGVNLMWMRATGYDWIRDVYTKVPVKIYVVLDNASKVEATWIPEIKKWFDLEHEKVECVKHGKTYTSELKWRNGSSVTFLSWEMDRTVFESIQSDIVIYDEPVPRPIFIALSRGQRAKNVAYETIIIGTPVTQEAAWLKEDFIEPWRDGLLPNVECFTASTEVNAANLGEGYIERFSALLTDKEKAVRLHGEFSSSEGLVFSHLYSPSKHEIMASDLKWEYGWPCVLAIDPHPAKRHTALVIGRRPRDGKYFVLEEFGAKLTAREFALKLHELTRPYRLVDVIVDSLGSTDGTGHEGFKSFIQVLNECNIRARATRYDEKKHEATVDRIRTLLELGSGETPKIMFCKDKVPNTIRELRNVGWLYDKHKELNKDKLDYDKLDYFSCLAYGLATNALSLINPLDQQVKYAKIVGIGKKGRIKRNYLNLDED